MRFADNRYRTPHAAHRTPSNVKVIIRSDMYISELLQYLIWPAFILLCWGVIKYALSVYEKKFSEKE